MIQQMCISIHAAQEGCDCPVFFVNLLLQTISIHAAQEGCDKLPLTARPFILIISIHAAQEGCDNTRLLEANLIMLISIHAAQEGCDRLPAMQTINGPLFQSTQPKRAATIGYNRRSNTYCISIHAAQEGCDSKNLDNFVKSCCISIHAAQEGCDLLLLHLPILSVDFNPRSPRGLRPTFSIQTPLYEYISIHAAQEGCDRAFLSDILLQTVISIHAAQEGCDSIRINCNYYSFYFYKSAKLTFLLN